MTKLARLQTGLVLLWAFSLFIGWRPLVDTFALSLRDEAYTHILLILPISAALIYLEWRFLRAMFAPSVPSGSALLAIAVVIACSAMLWSASLSSDAALTIRMFALVLWWIGAFVLCLGLRASRSVLFPLLFLFGLVPFPQVALNWIVALLQQGSTWSARVLFVAFGIPVAQDGFYLTIPGLTVQVAHECSSIRSSSMLLVTTMVLAQLLLRSPWRKALVIGIAVPLSVAKNGLRVFAIAMLGTRVDPEYLTGRFHHQGGIIFFAIALIVTFAILWILRRGEGPSPTLKMDPVKAATTED
jgi:exosortase